MNNNNSLNDMNDVVPPGKSVPTPTTGRRSIRDIPVNDRKTNKIDELLVETADFRAAQHQAHEMHEPADIPPPSTYNRQAPQPLVEERIASRTPYRKVRTTSSSPRKALWWIALVAVLVLAGSALIFFKSATLNVTVQTATISADVAATSASVISVSKEAVKEIAASGTSTRVEKKASGTITVYNNHSAEAQPLVATTRFQTPDGLVYRIDKPITVPGTRVVNGETVPGSVDAVVFADVAGDNYNKTTGDFTIPGFSGGPKFEDFYARTKTAITGGFSGMMAQVSNADLAAANTELEASLLEQAVADIESQKPANYIFLEDGIQSSFTSSVTPASNGRATVTGRLTVNGLVFDQMAVENAIADTQEGKRYNFDNLEVLSVAASSTPSFTSSQNIPVRLAGTLTSGNSFDPEVLKRVLAGKSKAQLQELLKGFPEIMTADASFRPFWSSTFPENAEKIKVNVTK